MQRAGNSPDRAKVLVRACRAADMARVSAIYAQAVREGTASFELEPPGCEEMTRRCAALVENGYPYLAAELAGRVEGFACAGPCRPREGYRYTVESTVYVDPGVRGRGLGGALMRRLIEAAARGGFRQMVAVIGDSENLASIKLHEGLGFAHAGRLVSVGYKHGHWLDVVLMQRALGPGDATPPGAP